MFADCLDSVAFVDTSCLFAD